MNVCEMCNNNHDGTYATGRFCNRKCAAGFSTKARRKEINERVSLKLSKWQSKELLARRLNQAKKAESIKKITAATIYGVSSRTAKKILIRMKLPCSRCDWFVEGVSCDMHHIVMVKNGGTNEHSNLAHICPNCHRMVHSGLILPNELVSFEDYVGNEWKKFYFANKIDKIMTNQSKTYEIDDKQPKKGFTGKKHTQECKDKISAIIKLKCSGKNNSQFGKRWIYHTVLNECKAVQKEEVKIWIAKGWKKGRMKMY